MVKWIALIVLALIGLLDVLLILGSAELERRHSRQNAEELKEAYRSGYLQGYADGRSIYE